MLSDGGNENGEKKTTTIGLIRKKATLILHVQHTFLVHFFAVVLHEYNVKLPETSLIVTLSLDEMSYVFSFTFFSLPLIFTLHWWPLAFLMLSPPAAATKFSCCSSKKKCLLFFSSLISRSRSLSPFSSLSFAGLPPTFSFSLSFSCSIFQICGHDN